MTPLALEAWTLDIVDRVARRANVEDVRVELKREWPKPTQAARILAGHANAARGTPILWLIGIDEQEGVVGAELQELANWYPMVSSCFDGIAPSLQNLNVTVAEKTIVALRFETDRAPFVVKNPAYGTPGGGAVEREVPWREGTRTMTARREHLVRMLAPLTALPEVEVLSAHLSAKLENQVGGEPTCKWYLRGSIYLNLFSGDQTVFPRHKHRVIASQNQGAELNEWSRLRLFPSGTISSSGSRIDSHTISATSSEAIATGPGQINFECSIGASLDTFRHDEAVQVLLSLGVVGSLVPLSLSLLLEPGHRESHESAAWHVRIAA